MLKDFRHIVCITWLSKQLLYTTLETLSENGNDPIQKQYSFSNIGSRSGFEKQTGFCVCCPGSAFHGGSIETISSRQQYCFGGN